MTDGDRDALKHLGEDLIRERSLEAEHFKRPFYRSQSDSAEERAAHALEYIATQLGEIRMLLDRDQ